jgi:hypothetical protein
MSDEILVAGKPLVAVGTGELSLSVLHDHVLGQAVLAARFIPTLATEPLAYNTPNINFYFSRPNLQLKTGSSISDPDPHSALLDVDKVTTSLSLQGSEFDFVIRGPDQDRPYMQFFILQIRKQAFSTTLKIYLHAYNALQRKVSNRR